MACAAVLEPNRDFPAWLEAQGVNAEVARAMDSELGIRDYGVLRACVGDGLVRAELLATARDRLPFGFYAVLRQVVKALQGAEPRDGGAAPRWDDAAVSSPGDVTLGGLVDVLLALFSGLSRELLLSARRLGAIDGQGNGGGGSSVEDSAMEQHLNCTENEEIRDVATSIIDHDQNKMMHIIKMEEHDDVDGGEGGLVDENDDGCEWRLQDGAESMAAACIDGPGVKTENRWELVIEQVTSLRGAEEQLSKSTQTSCAVEPSSHKQDAPRSVKIDCELGECTTAATTATAASATIAATTTVNSRRSRPSSGDVTTTRTLGHEYLEATTPNASTTIDTTSSISHAVGATTITAATTTTGKCTAQLEAKRQEEPASERKEAPRKARSLPYQCSICGMMFMKQVHLRMHTQKHIAEKPNRCDLCGSSFRYLSDLMCHWQTHVTKTS